MTRIAIAGAGVGGLSAAVSLGQAGFDVDIYEQAPELTEVGGDINMGPNACRVLFQLGFGPELDRAGVRPLTGHQRLWADGRTLQKVLLQAS
jgi:salicylate hydroxylase